LHGIGQNSRKHFRGVLTAEISVLSGQRREAA
jgi:hypothetical protein